MSGAPTLLPHPLTGAPFPSPVPPGTGWPGDPADVDTPVARTAAQARRLAATAPDVAAVDARSSVCRACDRLVSWREQVAVTRRRAHALEPYWGRPVPGWGDPRPRVLLLGLAPAAHGGNRTGRVFTGDRSGDWLYASLHRVGLAARPASRHAGDGQELLGCRVVAAVRCAPPANRPAPAERDACAAWLDREVALVLPHVRAVVALGSFAWSAALGSLGRCGVALPRPRPRFGHAAEVVLRAPGEPPGPGPVLLGCYHPSQQNTFTGRVSAAMLDTVLGRAAGLATGS